MKSNSTQFSTWLREVIFKILVAIQECVLASYFEGNLLTSLKQYKLLYFPVTGDGSLSLQLALHVRSTATCCLDFIPSWQKSP
jgi:hypothetical protein